MGNNRPIRVLQAFVANDKGGLTGYICQNYCFIDRNKIQFDFLTFEKINLISKMNLQQWEQNFFIFQDLLIR